MKVTEVHNVCGNGKHSWRRVCKGNAMLQQIDAYGGLPTFVEGVCDKRNSHWSVTKNGPMSKLS